MEDVDIDHARLSLSVLMVLASFVEEFGLGNVYMHPFQVRLESLKRRRLPDLFFVSESRMHLLENTQFNGAPDLILEVVSPDSQTRDRREKFLEYQAAGVKEYWLADPASRSFEAYSLNSSGKYDLLPTQDGQVFSEVLKGLFFRIEWVWLLKLPKPRPLLEAMSKHRKKLLSSRR